MLHIRYHPDFKFGRTLLFAGAASGISRLLAVIRHWDGEEIDLVPHLCQGVEGRVVLDGVVSLKLSRAKAGKDSYLEWTNDRGVWWISQCGQLQIVELLEGLMASAHP